MDLPQTLSHAYLITGGSEDSRRQLAQRLTAAYLCQGDGPVPCGVCKGCRKVHQGIHPDVKVVSPAPDKREITVDQARTLRGDVYVRPNEGKRKVYLIEPADTLNPAAQNALLKVLEDGPEYGAYLLLTPSPGKLLDTVRSRCETLALPPQEEAPDPQLVERGAALARLLLTGTELEVAQGFVELELERMKSAQLMDLLGAAQTQVAATLADNPRRGTQVLRALAQCRDMGVYNPGPGHALGWLASELFR